MSFCSSLWCFPWFCLESASWAMCVEGREIVHRSTKKVQFSVCLYMWAFQGEKESIAFAKFVKACMIPRKLRIITHKRRYVWGRKLLRCAVEETDPGPQTVRPQRHRERELCPLTSTTQVSLSLPLRGDKNSSASQNDWTQMVIKS